MAVFSTKTEAELAAEGFEQVTADSLCHRAELRGIPIVVATNGVFMVASWGMRLMNNNISAIWMNQSVVSRASTIAIEQDHHAAAVFVDAVLSALMLGGPKAVREMLS